MPDRLVEWDLLDFRVNGSRLEAIARELIRLEDAPLEDLTLEFSPGRLRASAKVRTAIPLPLRFVVREIRSAGRTVTVPLERVTALGFLPIPSFLTRLAGNRAAARGVVFDAASHSVVIQLDRFLPMFVDVEIAEIRIVHGGLEVRLARGGADPPGFGGMPWSAAAT